MTVMNNIKRSNNIFAVIDIGNTKVSSLIGSSAKNNNVQIWNFYTVHSRFKKDFVSGQRVS